MSHMPVHAPVPLDEDLDIFICEECTRQCLPHEWVLAKDCLGAAQGAQTALIARAQTFLVQCGPCDYGLVEYGCSCPTDDPRPVIFELVREVERLSAPKKGNLT